MAADVVAGRSAATAVSKPYKQKSGGRLRRPCGVFEERIPKLDELPGAGRDRARSSEAGILVGMRRTAAKAAALGVAALLVSVTAGVRADDKEKPKKDDKPAASSSEAEALAKYKGPEIAWARTWREAQEESAERGLLVFVHSHGST